MDLTAVKLMMVKVKMIRVAHVRAVRRRRRLKLLTPSMKAAANAFQRPSSSAWTIFALVCSWIISPSKRKKIISVTIKESPIIKKARITTMGLYARRNAGCTL